MEVSIKLDVLASSFPNPSRSMPKWQLSDKLHVGLGGDNRPLCSRITAHAVLCLGTHNVLLYMASISPDQNKFYTQERIINNVLFGLNLISVVKRVLQLPKIVHAERVCGIAIRETDLAIIRQNPWLINKMAVFNLKYTESGQGKILYELLQQKFDTNKADQITRLIADRDTVTLSDFDESAFPEVKFEDSLKIACKRLCYDFIRLLLFYDFCFDKEYNMPKFTLMSVAIIALDQLFLASQMRQNVHLT